MNIFLLLAYTVDKIRGISPLNAGQYRRSISFRKNQFTCFDKSKVISLDRLNDGYCDCPDGSDEPGTNACGNGEFYCENKGSTPKLIPKWMVGDGICDCCDGSDEADNPDVKCENLCVSFRKKSIELRSNLTSITEEGSKLHQKYANRGRLELSIRRNHFKLFEQQKSLIKKATNLINSLFLEVKSGHKSESLLSQLNMTIDNIESGFNEYDNIEKNIRKGTRKILPKAHYGKFNLRNRKQRYFNVESSPVFLPTLSSFFSKLLKSYETIVSLFEALSIGTIPSNYINNFNKISSINKKLSNISYEIMDIDFGPDKEYAPLYGQWYLYEKDNWYIEFIPYQNCTRSNKKGKEEFVIGKYERSEPMKWIFGGGSRCDGNILSSMEVQLHCRTKDSILSFEEVKKCLFVLHFGTPAACTEEYTRLIDNMDDEDLNEWEKFVF
ncbi:low-density lipoprotein receptor class A [Histomonas meleagridis]|uniref:low-density lipoprotein receptor class A n=1 Tax=Histomonas meleagridis TaxID=135588 RepID=UPI003559A380|nr:low-density lipoprotein receptor class A [Histomonas meleagridis]KAH0806970.1 low-density lipoprotein receptor class A [Histomonas meleagridis]